MTVRLLIVRFERLPKIPRSARTIELVINIPDAPVSSPPAPSPTKPPPPSRRARVWAFLKVAGPVVVAVAALVISILGYTDQHGANALAATASERQDAEKVSFISVNPSVSGSISAQNLSDTQIHEIIFAVSVYSVVYDDHLRVPAPHFYEFVLVELPDLPGCSTSTLDLLAAMTSTLRSAIPSTNPFYEQISSADMTVNGMFFTDVNGLQWQLSDLGTLGLAAGDSNLPPWTGDWEEEGNFAPVIKNPVFKSATGCS